MTPVMDLMVNLALTATVNYLGTLSRYLFRLHFDNVPQSS